MALAERSSEILDGLQRGWSTADLDLVVDDADEADRAGLILAPASPGRSGSRFRFHVQSGGERLGPSPDRIRRVLSRLDAEGIRGRLKLASSAAVESSARAASAAERVTLARAWDELLLRLPPDWSDLLLELALDSSDYIERGALLLAPLNPALHGQRLRFRSAHVFGYGAAPEMVRRCLERLDAERITGSLALLRVLCDTSPASTQGPVWRIGGRSL